MTHGIGYIKTNKYFTVLDINNAYLQLTVSEECRNTPVELFSYKRLPFNRRKNVLTPYDPTIHIVLIWRGLCVVTYKSGVENSIMFTSSSLSRAECKYPHLEREALSIIVNVSKFQKYLFGRKFILYSDLQIINHCNSYINIIQYFFV